MTSSSKIDNRKKYFFVPGKGPTKGLESVLSVETTYSINFTNKIQNCVYVCITMEHMVIYLSMVKRLLNLKQKILRLSHIHYV